MDDILLFGKVGRHEEAVFYWDKAFNLDETCISCLFSKAELYESTKQTKRAIQQYEDILEWLENHGYNLALEGAYPRRRISELQAQLD